MLNTAGRLEEAQARITESLQILFPALAGREQWSDAAGLQREPGPNLVPYETTLMDVCERLGVDPDPSFAVYFEYFKSEPQDRSVELADLPELDPPPLRRVTGDDDTPECALTALVNPRWSWE